VPLVFAVAFAFAFAFPSADDIAFAVACAGTKGSRSVLLNSEHGDKQDHTRIKIEIEIRIWKEPNSTLDLDLDIRLYMHFIVIARCLNSRPTDYIERSNSDVALADVKM
jgi:hypothetical protein